MDFYLRAARVLDDVATKRGSVASLATRQARGDDVKRLLAVCLETLKCALLRLHDTFTLIFGADRDSLERIIARVKFVEVEKALFRSSSAPAKGEKGKQAAPSARNLALVIVHDLLFARRGLALPKEHRVRQALERHVIRCAPSLFSQAFTEVLHRLRAEKEREKVRLGVTTDAGLASKGDAATLKTDQEVDAESSSAPSGSIRWLRVNELRWEVENAKAYLVEKGWREVESVDDVASSKECVHLPSTSLSVR